MKAPNYTAQANFLGKIHVFSQTLSYYHLSGVRWIKANISAGLPETEVFLTIIVESQKSWHGSLLSVKHDLKDPSSKITAANPIWYSLVLSCHTHTHTHIGYIVPVLFLDIYITKCFTCAFLPLLFKQYEGCRSNGIKTHTTCQIWAHLWKIAQMCQKHMQLSVFFIVTKLQIWQYVKTRKTFVFLREHLPSEVRRFNKVYIWKLSNMFLLKYCKTYQKETTEIIAESIDRFWKLRS